MLIITILQDNEHDLLLPALHGTITALKSAAKYPQVKKVILLGSISASIDYARPVGQVYGDNTWNSYSYEYAKTANSFVAYGAYFECLQHRSNDLLNLPLCLVGVSKTIAEKAAWDFVKNEKPSFKLVVIKPCRRSTPLHEEVKPPCSHMSLFLSAKPLYTGNHSARSTRTNPSVAPTAFSQRCSWIRITTFLQVAATR